jgi:hypothetical protein
MDRGMQEQARARHAGLAARGEDARDNALDGILDARIVKDDMGRFSTESSETRLNCRAAAS